MNTMKRITALLLALCLVACSAPKETLPELTDAQIQTDVASQLSGQFGTFSVTSFAVASKSAHNQSLTAIGTLAIESETYAVNGNFTIVYVLKDNAWVVKSNTFSQQNYSRIDESLWPDRARLEEDLMKAQLNLPIEQINSMAYQISKIPGSALKVTIDLIYRSSIATVTSQIDAIYKYENQAWIFVIITPTVVSLTDFTQRPLEEDLHSWSLSVFFQGDSNIPVTLDDLVLTSSNFNKKTGIMRNVYHLDKWIFDHLHYKTDVIVVGSYDLDYGWTITNEQVDLTKTLDLNVKEHFVWETIQSTETTYEKAQTIDLDLSGSMTITSPKETLWKHNVSGTAKINGVTYPLTFEQPDPLFACDDALVLRYGSGPKEYLILYYTWIERDNKTDWLIMSPDESEALIGS